LGIASSSSVLWEGKLYTGHGNSYVYCFDDSPTVPITVWADQDKGAEMWNNETITLSGGVYTTRIYNIPENEEAGTPEIYEEYYPPIPNAEVVGIFVGPDGSTEEVEVMADEDGLFMMQFNPTEKGEWSWTVWYPGRTFVPDTYRYGEAYTEYYSFNVVDPLAPSNGDGTTPPPPPPEEFPMEYVYYAVAAIVIVIVVVLAYLFFVRKR